MSLQKTAVALRMIKFSHSVFALPFALAALLLAADGWPAPRTLCWVIVAMVAARSAAMAFNRLVDRDVDRRNPRTRDRALPAGRLTPRFVLCFVLVCAAVFVLASAMLNRLCLWLSPVALAVILGYSYAKRFTSLTHLWLGAALGLTPLAAWVAVTGQVDGSLWTPAVLAVAVLFWVAGFDLIYSCQDVEFDRRESLQSLPAKLGTRRALRLAAWFHGLAVLALAVLAPVAQLGVTYRVGVAVVALLLTGEHIVARPGTPERLRVAFFHLNSAVGLVVLLAVAGEVLP